MKIKFTTENWNNILKNHPKIKPDDFNAWFKKISPSYKFIKDLKTTFQKDKKGCLIAKELPSLTLGDDKTWEEIFFVKHGIFFESFIKEVETFGFDYWQEYFNCLNEKKNLYVDGYVSILAYAVDNEEFLLKNNKELIGKLKQLKERVVKDKYALSTIEDLIKIYVSLIITQSSGLIDLLKEVSELLYIIPSKSINYYLKVITASNNLQNISVENEMGIHPLIKEKLNNLKSYNFVVDNAICFTLNLQATADNTSKSHLSISLPIQALMEIFRNANVFKDVYFYETRMSHYEYMLKAMLKTENEHKRVICLLEALLDICEDPRNNEETDYEALFNEILMHFDNMDNKTVATAKVLKF